MHPFPPPPSPTTMTHYSFIYCDNYKKESYYSVKVPCGTRVILEKWCSPEFYNQVLKKTNPRLKGYTHEYLLDPRFSYIFENLETLYADKLWDALKKKGTIGSLHFNFNREDFSRTGIANPRIVCNMFLNELTKSGDYTFCKRSNGKFHGMHFDVWENRAFTTHFTW
tara:strand:+ start:215 stop:715 length:501 start_codon:yes stop_codon:yes gene_type:complete